MGIQEKKTRNNYFSFSNRARGDKISKVLNCPILAMN